MRKILLIIIAISFSFLLHAQDAASFNFTFNHLALSVKDVDQSSNFYKNVVGLHEITNRTKMDGIRWFSLGEGKELHLISTIQETVVTNKAVHLGITTSNFDGFVIKLDKLKITYSDWTGNVNKVSIRADGIKQVYIQDPQ